MLPDGIPEYRVHTKPSRVEHWRHLVEIGALIIAAVWGFYVFVYQERIKPAGELPSLQTSASMTHQALQGGKELVTIDTTVLNTGSSDIAMGGLLVNAHGLFYAASRGELQELRPALGVTVISNGLKSSKPALLYSHLSLWSPLTGTHRYFRLPKGEQFTFAQSFVIERGRYDTLRVMYAYCYQRYDDNAEGLFVPKRAPDGAFDLLQMLRANASHAGLRCGGNTNYTGEFAL